MKTLAGFDIGGTKCAVIAGVLTGTKQPEILCKKQFATADHPDPLDCVTHLLEILQEMRQTHSDWEMESLGISCGGPLDPIQGIIQSPPNLPGWDNIPITQICEAKLGIPARLQVKGAKRCKQAYLWCRLTGVGPPMIAFHFSPSRSRDVAKSLLGDYSGTIIRDSYAAYEKLDCEVACCWAHARRRFLQAVENGYGKAEPLLKIIQELYQIERVAKERAEKKGTETALFQERKNARRQSQKLVQEFFAQCRVLKESERPSSPVAQAISYALNIEAELKKFLKDSRLNIDNNPAERLNRGIAIIRKNCLFAGSEAGGQRLAILYSFAATCKANGICFRKWLEDVLPRLNATPAEQIDSLIPKGEAK